MNLTEALRPGDLQQLRGVFYALPLDEITIELRDRDGPGGVGGWVPGNLWRPSKTVYLDRADFKTGPDGKIDLSHPSMREVVAHEFTHLEQAQRGFWYRLKMWFWRKFYKYNQRPHEIEAYERARRIREQWASTT